MDKPRLAKAHSAQIVALYVQLGWVVKHEFRAHEGGEPYEYLLEWQHGDDPISPILPARNLNGARHIHPRMCSASQLRVPFNAAECDPVSDPEPPAPPLPEPDPGVFHHEPGESLTQPDAPTKPTPEKDRA